MTDTKPKIDEQEEIYRLIVIAMRHVFFQSSPTRILIKADGTIRRLHEPLTFKEIETLINADTLDHVNLIDGKHVMYCDDMGKAKKLPFNFFATALYYERCGKPVDWHMVGDCIVLPHKDFATDDEEG